MPSMVPRTGAISGIRTRRATTLMVGMPIPIVIMALIRGTAAAHILRRVRTSTTTAASSPMASDRSVSGVDKASPGRPPIATPYCGGAASRAVSRICRAASDSPT